MSRGWILGAKGGTVDHLHLASWFVIQLYHARRYPIDVGLQSANRARRSERRRSPILRALTAWLLRTGTTDEI